MCRELVELTELIDRLREGRALEGLRFQPGLAILAGHCYPAERVDDLLRVGLDSGLDEVPVEAGCLDGTVEDDDEQVLLEERLELPRIVGHTGLRTHAEVVGDDAGVCVRWESRHGVDVCRGLQRSRRWRVGDRCWCGAGAGRRRRS